MPGAGHRKWELSQLNRIVSRSYDDVTRKELVMKELARLEGSIEKIERSNRSPQEIANELLTCNDFKKANKLIDELI